MKLWIKSRMKLIYIKKNKDEFQNNVFNIIEDTCLKLAENKL